MGENSKIEWTDHTFNPVVGCTKVSAACDFCYAETWAKRTGQSALWRGERRRTSATNWKSPVKWNEWAARDGVRRKVFCASLADVFDNQWDPQWRSDLFALIEDTPHLDWLLLTKRPQNISEMIPPKWDGGLPTNIWLGATVESQEEAARRIPHLLRVPARIHFLSCEPLLGPINPFQHYKIDWVICGGESGPKRRPMQIQWAEALRDDCLTAGVPFFMKQIDKVQPIPAHLMIREFPA